MGRYALGLDIGGTFTDFVLADKYSGSQLLHKHLTTYPDPATGVLIGLRELLQLAGIAASEVDTIVHSTTLVTNSIIERRGEPTGLLTTAGFKHVLDLGREQRYDAYDLFLAYPEPLIPMHLRHEIRERTLSDGTVLQPPDPAEVLQAVKTLVMAGCKSLAIAFLHAYRNPANEQAAAATIREHFPDLPLSLSSEVSPQAGEWERFSTTVADAFVRPTVSSYLNRLESELHKLGFSGQFFMMFSGAGAGSTDTARAFPIRLLESGPAAAVLAAAAVGRQANLPNLVAFDMGGTTAKACLIEDGQPLVGEGLEAARTDRFKKGSGLPIQVPCVELIEIGAGGGSIASKNDVGLLQVGPRSAAADPGPACYDQGGQEPTVTDANVLLGFLNPDFFLGGRMALNVARAESVISALADQLNMPVLDCAWGIHQVVNENMAAAARVHIIERGHDPRRFSLVASGGAGPAHAVGVAKLLGAPQVILPLGAGTLSGYGCLTAPLSFPLVRTHLVSMDNVNWDEAEALLARLTEQAYTMLRQAGIDPADASLQCAADMRMVGQVHHIRIQLPAEPLAAKHAASIAETFHSTYERLFRRTNRQMPLEFVNWHVVAASVPAALLPPIMSRSTDGPDADAACKGFRPFYDFTQRKLVSAPFYDRYRLQPGMVLTGPAVVEERESTAVLHRGDRAIVDQHGNLIVEVAK